MLARDELIPLPVSVDMAGSLMTELSRPEELRSRYALSISVEQCPGMFIVVAVQKRPDGRVAFFRQVE